METVDRLRAALLTSTNSWCMVSKVDLQTLLEDSTFRIALISALEQDLKDANLNFAGAMQRANLAERELAVMNQKLANVRDIAEDAFDPGLTKQGGYGAWVGGGQS